MSDLDQPSSDPRSPPIEGEKRNGDYEDNGPASSPSVRSQDVENVPDSKTPSNGPPDGGLAAWLVILGAWCTSFCTYGWLNSVGVFQEYYQRELLSQYSASTISWIPSLQNFFMLGMGPVVGALYDRYGPRWLILIGSVLHVFGIMMASLGTEYYQILLAQGLCSALGASALFQPAVTCAAGWFNKNRGIAFGILFTGSSVGGVIFPIMVSHLIDTLGFGWAMRISAFLILFLLIIANLTIRAYTPPTPQKITTAQLLKPWKELDFMLVTTGFFLFGFGFFVPINYLPTQALSAGVSQNLASYLLPILNAGSLFGRLFSGFAADKLGRYNIFVIACYLSGIWILALWLPSSSTAALIAFAVLFGFFSGSNISLLTPLIMAISPMPELGFRLGIVMFGVAIAGLTTNPINGAILDGAGGWRGLMIFSGVFCVAGTTLVLWARMRQTGWKILVRY